MSPAPQRVVVDTNVWLDYYLPNRPGYEIARRALLAAFTRKISLLYAVTTAKDVFFLSSMILKRDGRRDGRDRNPCERQRRRAVRRIHHLAQSRGVPPRP